MVDERVHERRKKNEVKDRKDLIRCEEEKTSKIQTALA